MSAHTTLTDKQNAKLAEIVAATQQDGGQGYTMAKPGDVKALQDLGLVEGNDAIKAAFGAIAWRATSYGINRVNGAASFDKPPVFGDPATDHVAPAVENVPMPAALAATAAAPAAGWAAPAAKVQRSIDDFEIEDGIEIPQSALNRKRGGARPELYPFARMEVGQSFFVAASKERPEPWKSLASTVNTAMARYAKPNADGSVRQDRSGKTVPVMTRTRVFTLVRSDKNGAAGARIFRTA